MARIYIYGADERKQYRGGQPEEGLITSLKYAERYEELPEELQLTAFLLGDIYRDLLLYDRELTEEEKTRHHLEYVGELRITWVLEGDTDE